jgi:chemotaxis protein MotB
MSGGGDGLFEEEHAPHENHERYLLTYADMITLLLALFIVLWAISNVDQQKFEEFRAGLSEGFGGPAIEGGNGILPGQQTVTDPAIQTDGDGAGNLVSTTTTTTTSPIGGIPGVPLDQIGGGDPMTINDPTGTDVHVGGGDGVVGQMEATQAAFALDGLLDRAQIEADEAAISVTARGVVITLNPDFGFAPGSYELQQGAIDVLDELFGPLREVTNQIEINGHTDSTPFDGPFGNWGLSSDRAAAVNQYLLETGRVPATRTRLAGYADSRPLAPNDTAEGRAMNRRIEIVLIVDPDAEVPTDIPGATVVTPTTVPTTTPSTTATTAPTASGGTGTSTTASTRSGSGDEDVTIVTGITQGTFPVPGRE